MIRTTNPVEDSSTYKCPIMAMRNPSAGFCTPQPPMDEIKSTRSLYSVSADTSVKGIVFIDGPLGGVP